MEKVDIMLWWDEFRSLQKRARGVVETGNTALGACCGVVVQIFRVRSVWFSSGYRVGAVRSA